MNGETCVDIFYSVFRVFLRGGRAALKITRNHPISAADATVRFTKFNIPKDRLALKAAPFLRHTVVGPGVIWDRHCVCPSVRSDH